MALGLAFVRTLHFCTLFTLLQFMLGLDGDASKYKKIMFISLAVVALMGVMWSVYGTDRGKDIGNFYQTASSKAQSACIWLSIFYLVSSVAIFFVVVATLG